MKFPIPQDWNGSEWCRWSVCWPDSEEWRGLLRGLLTLPQRGWTWDERTGSIIDVQQIGREITAQNLPLNGVIMACNDTNLADAFNNIAASIELLASRSSGQNCCSTPETTVNNSVQNYISQPVGGNPVPVYGSEPPLELAPGEYPPEYSSWVEYDADKCRKANAIITATIASNRALGAITAFNFAGLTAIVVMALGGILVVAPPLMPVLIGALILLAAAMHNLDAAADHIEANKTEWVCALYTGGNIAGMVGAVADLLDILVSAIGATGPIAFAVKTVILVLLNTDNINKLLSGSPLIGSGDVDCLDCLWYTCSFGTVIAHDANSVTLEAVDPGDFDALVAVAYSDSSDLYNLEAEITGWTAPSDHPEFSASWDTREGACGAGLGYDWENMSGSPEAGPVAARTFQHRGNTVFTVKYTRTVI